MPGKNKGRKRRPSQKQTATRIEKTIERAGAWLLANPPRKRGKWKPRKKK